VHSISQHVYERMFEYSWPGNVRELQNVIERAVLLSKGDVIEENILPTTISVQPEMASVPSPAAPPAAVKADAGASTMANAQDMTLEQMAWLIVNRIPDSKDGRHRTDTIKQFEGAIVNAALERTRGNKQAAANLLGLYRPRLYTLLRKHNLGKTIREVDRPIAENDLEEREMDEMDAHAMIDNGLTHTVRSAGD
jgi:sigma-54 dependent transcriptional regulator, acetoin dehydrogenase operon transcriptional activator AcoR